jgi:hypothetical protein
MRQTRELDGGARRELDGSNDPDDYAGASDVLGFCRDAAQ